MEIKHFNSPVLFMRGSKGMNLCYSSNTSNVYFRMSKVYLQYKQYKYYSINGRAKNSFLIRDMRENVCGSLLYLDGLFSDQNDWICQIITISFSFI